MPSTFKPPSVTLPNNSSVIAELQIAHAENRRLQEQNRQLESKLTVRTLALRQILSLLENEVRHRTNLSAEIKNIRSLLEDKA